MTAFKIDRRALLAASLGGLALPAVARAQAPAWTREAMNAALRASGRNGEVSAATFQAIQQRKARALASIENYLKARFQGEADPAVLRAFAEVPREYFHYNYDGGRPSFGDAYESEAKPWSIGFGSALSDYLGQAYMTQVCAPKPEHVVLEIGTGSGFQSALLSRIVAKQYSIEIIEPLGRGVSRIFEPLGYTNVETRVGDGFFGWPEVEGGFDTIIVTCAAQYVPPAIIQQLRPGGRLVIPIGQPFRRGQFLYIYTKEEDGRVRSRKDVGVYFIPMTGAMMNRPPPPGTPVAPAGEPVAPSPGHAPIPRRPAG
ncbi:protein-L-isoaspartate O-methyltransferase family protein [Falsiroseomonas ponticola]|uniref:protein-L-isoaspartate O-methyltransferase family protein n=1 Tax=Falsiroseomonas ponticola TaxID=2786951 RepID=UPI0019319BA6|nr:protein-L-isoaspartate O-methyltransferase [Roseomonas ponticola]